MLDIGEYITEVERYQDDGDGDHNNGSTSYRATGLPIIR